MFKPKKRSTVNSYISHKAPHDTEKQNIINTVNGRKEIINSLPSFDVKNLIDGRAKTHATTPKFKCSRKSNWFMSE